MIIRDCNGLVVAALSKYLPGRFAADQVEALAMEQGILLAQELQLSRVILESDALAVVQALNDNSTGNELGHILQGILLLCESFEFCSFKHVNRVFNVVAHELAQLARCGESSCLWYGVFPPCCVCVSPQWLVVFGLMPCCVCPSVVLFFGLLCWSLGCVVFGLLPCCFYLSAVYSFQVLMIFSSI